MNVSVCLSVCVCMLSCLATFATSAADYAPRALVCLPMASRTDDVGIRRPRRLSPSHVVYTTHELHVQSSPNSLRMFPMAVARSSSGEVLR